MDFDTLRHYGEIVSYAERFDYSVDKWFRRLVFKYEGKTYVVDKLGGEVVRLEEVHND